MCIRKVTSKLVELGRADWTDSGGGGTRIGSAAGVRGMARGSFESGKASGKSDMEQRSIWEGKDFVVGLDE